MADSITQITLGELREQIKRESRLSGTSDLDDIVVNIINELLLEYTLNDLYFELLQLNVPILTLDATGTYNLPADFAHIGNARYQNSQGSSWTLWKRANFLTNPIGTRPKYYQLTSGGVISIVPFSQVVANETIFIDYYSHPAKLSADADLFPIPKLIGPLKQKAIYRALLYNNAPTASAFKQGASEDEARGKS